MPNARLTPTLLLLLALTLFFLPTGAQALPEAPAVPEDTAAASALETLAAAWDWLLSLVEPPEEMDGAFELRAPTWNEGSHLDPNGGC